jgi:hypothetical protein
VVRAVKPQLFDTDAKERRKGTTKALVPVSARKCPMCGTATTSQSTHQPALLRHGGYGATMRTTTVNCTNDDCRWWLEAERTEVKPDKRALTTSSPLATRPHEGEG